MAKGRVKGKQEGTQRPALLETKASERQEGGRGASSGPSPLMWGSHAQEGDKQMGEILKQLGNVLKPNSCS